MNADLEGRKTAVREEIASVERVAKAIHDKLDRLDEAFPFERSIDIETYEPCWNPGDRTGFQLLAADRWRE